MSMGGGGSGGTTQNNTFTPPMWTQNQFPDVVQAGTDLYSAPQQQWYGQQIAGINDTQNQGMQMLANLSGNYSPDMAAARRNLQLTASGAYENPYASVQTLVADNPYLGAMADVGQNQYIDQRASPDYNAFAGMSPAYKQMKQNALNDAGDAFNHTVAPATDSAFNRAGAFHSGAYEAQVAADRNNLAKQLGDLSTSMDVGQWDRSANLNQQYLNNSLQAQLTENARQQAGQQNWLQYATGAQQQNLDRNSGLAQAAIGQGVQAQQNDLGRASQYWDAERNRQMGAYGDIQSANMFDQNNARNMIGLGDIQRGYTQDLLNQSYQNWQGQMNYPQSMIDNYMSVLQRASGNYGTNASTSYGPSYQANPFATAFGVGLTGAGLYNAYGG